jgi:hypothetical protein
MDNGDNILNGLVKQHAQRRDRERKMICDRQYQTFSIKKKIG